MLQDATFEMERRRNRPEKYDRELVHKTGGRVLLYYFVLFVVDFVVVASV